MASTLIRPPGAAAPGACGPPAAESITLPDAIELFDLLNIPGKDVDLDCLAFPLAVTPERLSVWFGPSRSYFAG